MVLGPYMGLNIRRAYSTRIALSRDSSRSKLENERRRFGQAHNRMRGARRRKKSHRPLFELFINRLRHPYKRCPMLALLMK
jgi:hypothetical protein